MSVIRNSSVIEKYTLNIETIKKLIAADLGVSETEVSIAAKLVERGDHRDSWKEFGGLDVTVTTPVKKNQKYNSLANQIDSIEKSNSGFMDR